MKLEIYRVGGNSFDGQLVINEIEYYEGYLSQTEIPRNFLKMVSPRTPEPQKVYCSSFLDQMRHCYRAFDGEDSESSAWVTKGIGVNRQEIASPQWVILDMGPRLGDRIRPTSMKIQCGWSGENISRGCPMTFALMGSNRFDSEYEYIAKYDMYDFDADVYSKGGKMFHFFDESPNGRLNGQKCGSCDKPPHFTCSLNSYDRTCASRYCGGEGVCSMFESCAAGSYLEVSYMMEGNALMKCAPCPPGRYGDKAGLVSSQCSGYCDAGCYCTLGSVSSCQYSCEGLTNMICPMGSPKPIQATSGEYYIPYNESDRYASDIELIHPTFTTECLPGHYCINGVKLPCPVGRYGNSTFLSTEMCSGECNPGYFCPAGSVVPKICPVGYFCVDGKIKTKCTNGHYGEREGRYSTVV